MLQEKYPIIEFDETKKAFLEPFMNLKTKYDLPTHCVISFFGEAINELVSYNNIKAVGSIILESWEVPIYIYNKNGCKIAIVHGLGSGPYAAGLLEKLIVMGCNRFIVCGGCGVLVENIPPGNLLIPYAAIRDEGTSYHYIRPSREINANEGVVAIICKALNDENIPYKRVKTWTTDAIFRETIRKIEKRKLEGCETVEMEAASFFAVSQFRDVKLGQILYAGDDLSQEKWDGRNWKELKNTRSDVLELAIKICGRI